MIYTPPRNYTKGHLQSLSDVLRKDSNLLRFITKAKNDNVVLYNNLLTESHSREFSSYDKNHLRSIRCLLFDVNFDELPLWVSETDPELKSILEWRFRETG